MLVRRRRRVVAGTSLGRAAVLAGATVVGFGIVGVLLLYGFGAARWGAFVRFLVGVVGVGAVVLALAVLVSSVAGRKTHALGLSLLVWVWFLFVHGLLALGVVAAFSLLDVAVTALVVSNPASVFRVLVLRHLGTTGASGVAATLATTDVSPGLLLGALAAWCVWPVAAACGAVRRRRL